MDSRYVRIVKTPIYKRKRVRKIHGAFEDRGKYFYCWVCGAICSVDRNVGATGYGGVVTDVTPVTMTPQEQYQDLGRMPNQTLTYDDLGDAGTVVQDNLGGASVTVYYTPRKVDISKGCWFCGATNIY